METRVQKHLSALSRMQIVELYNAPCASTAQSIIIRKAVLDYMEAYNKFAYEQWLMLSNEEKTVKHFYDLCKNCPDYFSMSIMVKRAVIAVEKREKGERWYECVTSDIRIDEDGNFIATDITIDADDKFCSYIENDISHIDVVIGNFKKIGNFETIDNGRFAIARLNGFVRIIGNNAKKQAQTLFNR